MMYFQTIVGTTDTEVTFVFQSSPIAYIIDEFKPFSVAIAADRNAEIFRKLNLEMHLSSLEKCEWAHYTKNPGAPGFWESIGNTN